MSTEHIVNYENQEFTTKLSLVSDGVQGYATINTEMFKEEDGLAPTGCYHVYMLHPIMGSTQFLLEPDNSYHGWKRIGGAIWLDKGVLKVDVMNEIFNALNERKENLKAKKPSN